QAQIISYEEYTPYGSTSYEAVRSQTETPKRYHYTGKERDQENGFTYHGSRYYAPWLGRWVSCDSGRPLADGANMYEFVKESPIVRFDPDGMSGIKVTEADVSLRFSNILVELNWAFATEVRISVNVGGISVKTIADYYGHPPGQPNKLWHFEIKIDDQSLPGA